MADACTGGVRAPREPAAAAETMLLHMTRRSGKNRRNCLF